MSVMGMAILLVISLLTAIADFRAVSDGHVIKPVSFYTLVLAGYLFLLAGFASLGRLLRVAVTILGIGATIRACTYYLHASDDA